jgi:hypothetical protein
MGTEDLDIAGGNGSIELSSQVGADPYFGIDAANA